MSIRLAIIIPNFKKKKIKVPARISELCLQANIDITDIDIDKCNLDDFPKFDVLLHKITDYVNDENATSDNVRRKKKVVTDYALRNPHMKIIDNFENCEKILDRKYQTEVLKTCECTIDNINIFVPKIVSIKENSSLETLQTTVTENKFRFPVLGKPLGASLSEGCHDMTLVFSYEYLKDLPIPCLLQEFCNHNGVLYKVFVIGNNYHMCERPSVKNIISESRETLYFDTRNVSKTGKGFLPKLHDIDPAKRQWLSSDENPNMLNRNVVEEIIKRVQVKTGFYLFGLDILIDDKTKDYALIDLNQFPGYTGIKEEHFNEDLVTLIKHLRAES